MDLHHTSKLVFLSLECEPIEAPFEWQKAYLEVLVPSDNWQEVKIYLQGKQLSPYLKSIYGKSRKLDDNFRNFH